jgi:hypothetical protein
MLLNLRGGGTAAASAALLATAAATVTGGASATGDVAIVTNSNDNNNSVMSESFLGMAMSPEGKAVVLMAVSMALHYLGYSMARPVTVALFTSVDTGYSGAWLFVSDIIQDGCTFTAHPHVFFFPCKMG